MTRRIFVVCCLFLIILASCRKEMPFPVRIVNQSGYDINSLSFYGTVSGEDIPSLNAGDTSEIVIASYERRVRLTPKLLRLIIHVDSQQVNAFNVVRNAPTFPFSNQVLDENTNTIVITTEVAGDTLRFLTAIQ